MPIKLTANNGNIDLKVPIKQLGGGAVDSVNGMTGDVVLTANDVGAIDENNGMTPVECVFPPLYNGGPETSKTLYVKQGIINPVDYKTVTDDIKTAWRNLTFLTDATVGKLSSYQSNIKGIAPLIEIGVFGEDFFNTVTYNSPCVFFDDPITQRKKITIYTYNASKKSFSVIVDGPNGFYATDAYSILNDEFSGGRVYDQYLRPYSNNANDTNSKLGQLEMEAAPTKDMQIATKKYVDDSITNVYVDLTDYYTKTEVDAKIPSKLSQLTDDVGYAKSTDIPDVSGFITSIPDEYVTETELNAKGYLTEHQSLSEYAKKSELFSKDYNDLTNKPTIPSVEGLASTQYVDEKVAAIVVPSLDGYATEQWVEGKGYLTQHQSLADYSTTTQVQSMIDTAIAGITDGEAVRY